MSAQAHVRGLKFLFIKSNDNTRVSNFNNQGEELLTKIHGGFGFSNPLYRSILDGNSGDFIMIGTDFKDPFNLIPIIAKIDKDGNEIWSKSISVDESEQLGTLIHFNDKYLAVGIARDSEIILYTFNEDGENIVKSNTGLKVRVALWGMKAIETSDEGFIITSTTEVDTTGNSDYNPDYQLSKFDSNGTLEWNLIYGGEKTELYSDIIESKGGGYFLLGSSKSYELGHYDVHLLKVDEAGEILWEKIFYTDKRDVSGTIYEDDELNLYITGTTGDPLKLFIIKLDENGNPL